MASRMDRYYKSELVTSGRSTKNKSLYKQIEDLDNYTNIEGVATIEKSNEIDISKVKEMLKNREDYKKQRHLRTFLEEEKEIVAPKVEEKKEEPKNYDINDILSKIKEKSSISKDKYRSLGEEQFNVLKSLNQKGKDYDIEKEEAELKELINTITANKSLNDLANTDDVGLLDELKSNTMVGDASSIKKIIDEEKDRTFKNDLDENTMEMDKSFYTSSFGFTQSDFEELKNINHKLKKGNKFIIILLVAILLVVIAGVLFIILK